MIGKDIYKYGCLLVMLLFPFQAGALQPMHDGEMASITGRDGIVVDIATGATGITMDELRLDIDAGTTSQASLVMENIALRGVNQSGTVVGGGPAHVTQSLDVGSDGTDPYLLYQLDISAPGTDRARLSLDNLRLGQHPDRSYGSWALDGEGTLKLMAQAGFFNMDGVTALSGEIRDAIIYHRQLDSSHANLSYLILDDLRARWEMKHGKLGLTDEGIVMNTLGQALPESIIDVALDFSIFFKQGGQDFTPGGRGLMYFGWLGGLKDVELIWRTGGAWSGVTAGPGGVGTVYDINNQSGGLNFSSRWDFVSAADAASLGEPDREFRWVLGETTGDASSQARITFELGDWSKWGNNPYSHYFPMIALDTINGAGQGPGGLCWGFAFNGPSSAGGACAPSATDDRRFVNLEPGYISSVYGSQLTHNGDAGAVALVVRGGQLQSYSRKVTLLEQDALGNVAKRAFDWGLIYTFANIDANIYLYPGGNPGDLDRGLIADLAIMSQTFEEGGNFQGFNWDKGSHLMIADTRIDPMQPIGATRNAMGIGLLSTSFLVLADDTRIWLRPYDAGPQDYHSGGLDLFSPRVRFAMNTTFGGGILPDAGGGYGVGPRTVLGSLIGVNLEGMANMRLSPSDPNVSGMSNYLGYSWAIRLLDMSDGDGYEGFGTSPYGSYISFAEPNRPDVALRLANITGDISLENGRIDIRGSQEDGDNTPKLVIQHDVKLGHAAGPRIHQAAAGATLPGPALGAGMSGQELRIDRIMLGDATLGRIVMPSAQIHASITLQPQP